jgi:NAD(P)-dependent dehydrogenase (short-subunit alcohol dehydrogenase family)
MSTDLFDVSAKTALVTGGSRGIGLMIARGLVQAGARVVVSSRKRADVEGAAAELAGLGDCVAIPVTSRRRRVRPSWRARAASTSTARSTSSSTTPAPYGVRRLRSSHRPAGRRSSARTSRASFT